jgi:hypothetical protein
MAGGAHNEQVGTLPWSRTGNKAQSPVETAPAANEAVPAGRVYAGMVRLLGALARSEWTVFTPGLECRALPSVAVPRAERTERGCSVPSTCNRDGRAADALRVGRAGMDCGMSDDGTCTYDGAVAAG